MSTPRFHSQFEQPAKDVICIDFNLSEYKERIKNGILESSLPIRARMFYINTDIKRAAG
jgi:hypothetical protein